MNLAGDINMFLSGLKRDVGNGVQGLANEGDPSQDDASELTFRGLGNAGRSAFRSGALLGKGKIVRKPTLAVVGDKGPELVAPLGNKARLSELARQLKRMQRTATA